MDRRRFLLTSLAGALAAPLAAEAQPAGRVIKIGILSTVNPRTTTFFEAMVQRLRELGDVESQNLVIEFRNAEDDVTRLPALAAELVRLNVNIILASGPEVTLHRAVPPRRRLRRQDPPRRPPGHPPRGVAEPLRAGPQPEDRQGSRPDHPAVAAASGGSG
jgi:hypothetical protein